VNGGSGWVGTASTRIVPSAGYWEHVAAHLGRPVEAVRKLSDDRVNELRVGDLPPPPDVSLLEVIADDGWFRREVRIACANPLCPHEPTEEDIAAGRCPVCDTVIDAKNTRVTVYVRDLAPTRDVDWVVVIHGMNTRGAWQEGFSWFLGTTWGRSIPVAIYKYGMVISGVLMPLRRTTLLRRLRAKLSELRAQARSHGYGEVPDVVAHSFGTWLLGHLIRAEMEPGVEDPLRFGRVILTGCVLRPDFDWSEARDRGLVAEVLNHYATKDPIVPLAHFTIWDSGPSGRRGFDSAGVINARAEGLGHSDLLGARHFGPTYEMSWRPFLTLPAEELTALPDISPLATRWRHAPLPLRGTVFPVLVLPLVLALLLLLVEWIGNWLADLVEPIRWVAGVAGAGLGVLLLAIGVFLLTSRVGRE